MLRKLLDSPWFYFLLAGLLLVVGVFTQIDIRLPSRPAGSASDLRTLRERDDVNLVFVLIDTLRADRLGSYGYERDTSPILDMLAGTGVRFARVEAQSSWTKSSMASLWLSAYPRQTGVQRYDDGLTRDATMPAEIMAAAGFETAGIYRNGWVANNFGFDQGFDLYFQPRPSPHRDRFERRNPSAHPLQGTDLDATDSAAEFLRGVGDKRFFLYLHYMDVHQFLYDSNSAKFGSRREDAYDNAIHWTDRNLSYLMATLDDQDLLDRTLIVIAADHGEAFGEHGIEGHARDLYQEVVHTPWIIIPPFRIEPGIVVEAPVQNVDLWPTVLDLLGLPPLAGAQGQALLPLIEAAARGETPDGAMERDSISELDRFWGFVGKDPTPIVALKSGDFRLIHDGRTPGQPELFDHSVDPQEKTDVADQHPEVVKALGERIEAYLASKPAWETPQVQIDEMRLNQLKALGYLPDH